MAGVIPSGTGAPWRFVAMSRYPANKSQGGLSDARSRKLTFALAAPGALTFDISGRSPQLGWLEELRSDVVAYRWSDAAGTFVPMFRGCVTASTDKVDPTVHTVSLVATDYRGILARRLMRAATTYTAVEQFTIATALANYGDLPPGVPAAGRLGLAVATLGPSGAPLAASGIVRTRAYLPGQVISTGLDDLATDISGFEYSVDPDVNLVPTVNIFYPQRGVGRTHWVAHYGSTVTDVQRVVTTTTFANYSMVIGGPATSGGANQIVESTTGGYVDPVGNPEGAWMTQTAETTVIDPVALQQDSDGYLVLYGDLEPAYTLTLAPGRWTPADAWLGDSVRLIVNSGRLDVDTVVRITAIGVDIDDAGRATVTLTAGITPPSAGELMRDVDRRLDKLEMR